MKVLVAGAGGFIGGHLVKRLIADGYEVKAVDVKPFNDWWQLFPQSDNFELCDLNHRFTADNAVAGCQHVYNLAADMGGMGFIEKNKAKCMLSVIVNTNLLLSSKDHRVQKYFYASSACVYPGRLQNDKMGFMHQVTIPNGLREDDAYPADPEDGYGWEKLFSERMCRHFMEDFKLPVYIARFHNVYGPFGTWRGGREKAPAAICRKVAQAYHGHANEISIWGDGRQVRSFMYVDDCIDGIMRLTSSDTHEPINIGSSEAVTINDLVTMVETIAGVSLPREYDINAPKGVDGRNSDNTFIKLRLDWEPKIKLEDGLRPTYEWIAEQYKKSL